MTRVFRCNSCSTTTNDEDSPLGEVMNVCQECWEKHCDDAWWKYGSTLDVWLADVESQAIEMGTVE